jgi:N-acetylmuramoyl-L-alanine amidase
MMPGCLRKTNKKDLLEMSTGVKNGKHSTYNIYNPKLLLMLAILALCQLQSIARTRDNKWVIVLDPGHGGYDPGALGSFSSEKNITLAIALKTGNYLEKNLKNVVVIYTRTTDVSVELRDRPAIANKNNADLFVSIHANSASPKTVKGTETFVMGLAKDQANLEVAMKENEVIMLEKDYSTAYEGFDPKSPESYIMFSLMQNIFLSQSTSLASMIQNEYTRKNNRFDRGVKEAGFWVLYNTTMPSVLTETGFITNPDEEKYLNSQEGQDKIAASIFRACNEYMDDIDSKSSKFPVKGEKTETKTDSGVRESADTDNIMFMVQIATSPTSLVTSPENFNGLKNVIEIAGENQSRYAAGKFNDYKAAVNYRKEIEDTFPDAFVIAVRGNKIIPLQQALDFKKRNSQNMTLNEKDLK